MKKIQVVSILAAFVVMPSLAFSKSMEGVTPFVGVGMGFGESFLSKSGSNPGLGFDMGVEPGFIASLGSWSRMEGSAEFFVGRASYSGSTAGKGDLNLMGMMPKLGYGYSMGEGLFAVWTLGGGPVYGTFSGRDADDNKIAAKTSLIGLGLLGAAHLVMPISDSLEFLAGIKVTHLQFNLGDVDLTAADGSTKSVDYGEGININQPAVDLAMRFKF